MAGKGFADNQRQDSERGVDELAEMLYTRGGYLMGEAASAQSREMPKPAPTRRVDPATAPTAPTPRSLTDDLSALSKSMQQTWPTDVWAQTPVPVPAPALAPTPTRAPVPQSSIPRAVTTPVNQPVATVPLSSVYPSFSQPQHSASVDESAMQRAGLLASNLEERFQELDRRERKLSEMMTAFDQEQRRFRLMQQELRDDSTGREAQLAEQENLLKQRLTQGERLLDELQRREQEVSAERQRLGGDVQRELEVERTTLRHERALVETERKDLQSRLEQVRQQQENDVRQMRRELEVERRRIRGQIATDVDTEREALRKERDEWLRTRAEQETILQRQKDAHGIAMQRAEQLLADQQKQQLHGFEERGLGLDRQFNEARERFETERRAWEAKREAEREQLERQRFLNVETLRRIEDEKSSREQQFNASLQRAKEQHDAALLAERQGLDGEFQKRRTEFALELEKLRTRFQDETARQRDQLAAERKRFDETLEIEKERVANERRNMQAEFEQRATDWAKRRDEEFAAMTRERQELEHIAIQSETEFSERRQQLEVDARKAREDGLAELRANWDVERQDLRQRLAADIEAERKQLAEEKQTFNERQELEQAALKRAKESHEAALRQARADIINERQQANESIKLSQSQHEAQQIAARGMLERQLKDRFQGTEQRIAEELAQLSKQTAAHQNVIAETSAQFANERREIDDLRSAQAVAHQQREAAFVEEERRLKSETHTHTILVQQWNRRVEAAAAQLRRRRAQLDRYRELLVERERSLLREEELVSRTQAEFEAEKKRDSEFLTDQHALLERQRQDIVDEQQRAEGTLNREYEKLKERSHRIELLRKELEQTSLRNLEDRLAAEEAFAEFVARIGEPSAKQRVDEVRTVIAGKIREMQHAARTTDVDETVRMVAFTQKQLEEESLRLKKDRESLSRRTSEREHELQEQEAKLETKNVEWQIREVQWRQMRDDWLKQRVEAEQIIRGLLDELAIEV